MPLLLAVTLAAAIQPSCSWDHPGHNPYTGGAAAAIDRYTDIPEAVRSTLKRRMQENQSDDKVSITREHITGKYQYDPAIRDMHFGKASVCATVTRDKWADTRNEPGAVYCVEQHCILVPRICGNVSRVTRSEAVASTPAAPARELEAPVEFTDPGLAELGLFDAPKLEPIELDPAEEAQRRIARQRALDALDHLQDDEELAKAGDDTRHVGFGGRGGRGSNGSGDVDDVSPVPEADTWGMLLAGLGLVGWQARRRAKAAAKAGA
ncbi:MHFG family PEP-CTERM protein [Duganella sp. PWIR1]